MKKSEEKSVGILLVLIGVILKAICEWSTRGIVVSVLRVSIYYVVTQYIQCLLLSSCLENN